MYVVGSYSVIQQFYLHSVVAKGYKVIVVHFLFVAVYRKENITYIYEQLITIQTLCAV